MSLVGGIIPNLFNGVSQQPATVRSRAQSEAVDDYYPTIAVGLRKRPPTMHVAKLRNTTVSGAYVHIINRSVTERYAVVILNGDLEVYNLLTGAACTVTFPDGKTYLNNTTPRSGFSVVTVADTSFIVNKSVVVAQGAPTATGTLMGSKQAFSALPASGTVGDVWTIQGDSNNQFTKYYVKWTGSVWAESTAPGVKTDLDAATMPFKLFRSAPNTFVFQKNTWDQRLVGDDTLNPFPSFVGMTLQDVFFFRNRLGFLADENVILSRNGKYFNFFAETMTAVLDTDPIDVTVDASASPDRINILKHAVPFNKVLLLFSDQTQFQLTGGVNSLTPQTVKTDVLTSFESASAAKPALSGSSLFFATSRGNYAGLREYYVQTDTVANDAADVTAHVPSYLPANVFRLSASSNEDCVFALTENEPNRVYVYKFYWGEEMKKLQSAWLRFNFTSDTTILGCSFIDQQAHIVLQRADGIYVETMDMHPKAGTTSIAGFAVMLDRQVSLTGTYSSGTNLTTWTLPYALPVGTLMGVRGSAFGAAQGATIPGLNVASTTVTATGDYSAGPALFGVVYTARMRFSEQFLRDEKEIAITTGKLKLKRWLINYSDTGYFRVEVTPRGRETFTYQYTGKTLGVYPLSTQQFGSGTFKCPAVAGTEGLVVELVNDSHLQSIFQSAAWEGEFVTFSNKV